VHAPTGGLAGVFGAVALAVARVALLLDGTSFADVADDELEGAASAAAFSLEQPSQPESVRAKATSVSLMGGEYHGLKGV
jgi:hypothetical protein